MSRKVCDTWFYAILICSVGVSLYYYYPEVQNRFPQATAILEMHYKKITSQFVSSMQPYVPLLRSISLPPGMFNADTLARYDGKTGSKGLYLALLGKVYDVEKGAKYYREGGSYSFFAGKDASRAYITGDFSDTGLTDDLTGLSEESVAGLANWIEMYHKDYPYMGKLVGRYYTITGEKTAELRRIEELLSRAQAVKDKEDEQKKMFPPCNSEFNTKTGHRVWCSNQSGGIERSWDGVPRRFHPPGMSQERCVCVRTTGAPYDNPSATTNNGDLSNPNLKEYPNCEPSSKSCKLK
ncbi:neuferricin-like isoform X1 [Varroa jacobsoni]|nr:neuferricin-like isoform X2 [Varroa destructor]XP_022668211.1 neuferricin-like isoform X2 [Varroa destructor]XP_022668212.1 neuferricin-like isoform X2 [Varroa destructor]XP_022668213.1 neuferricin-like isoform X2 [Varroa destructor]XP_022686539.1 neuferricin-like isoform X1 [Varroa jacobsoni]XP_022686549.1 neuferricin-like isoform X1 [Varroa jacobsoni]XP_022686559.1 neuferricin-like isoform X1 [Varroa jacobsoni]